MSETLASDDTVPNAYRYDPPSLYVTDAWYAGLVEVSADLDAPTAHPLVADPALRQAIGDLLTLEARLLDQKALRPWLDLYSQDCAYWIAPASPAPDPRTGVTLEFHDRRRLLDRIARLETGFAYSQYPASRTSRRWSGLEIWPSPSREDEWRARYNFSLAEFRNGHHRLLSGWTGFVLRREDDGLRLMVKQVNLIDCDRAQGNNSFFL